VSTIAILQRNWNANVVVVDGCQMTFETMIHLWAVAYGALCVFEAGMSIS
jgi:hypothetical protein